MLTMMVGANISSEQLISIAERTIMEADQDKVGDLRGTLHYIFYSTWLIRFYGAW